MIALAGTLFAAQAPSTPGGAMSKDQEAVRKAEADRFAAMLKADVAALDTLLAADLTYTHGDGRVIGKAAFISDFKTGAFKYTTIEPNDVMVRVFGDVAVVTCIGHFAGPQFTGDLQFMRVWQRRDGHWRVIAATTTSVPS